MTKGSNTENKSVTKLCEAVMVGVARVCEFDKNTSEDVLSRSCAIMREEIKAFFTGDKYKEDRELVRQAYDETPHLSMVADQAALLSLVSGCVERVQSEVLAEGDLT